MTKRIQDLWLEQAGEWGEEPDPEVAEIPDLDLLEAL
jgi:hypothetical protein